jgi:hypothetical protein
VQGRETVTNIAINGKRGRNGCPFPAHGGGQARRFGRGPGRARQRGRGRLGAGLRVRARAARSSQRSGRVGRAGTGGARLGVGFAWSGRAGSQQRVGWVGCCARWGRERWGSRASGRARRGRRTGRASSASGASRWGGFGRPWRLGVQQRGREEERGKRWRLRLHQGRAAASTGKEKGREKREARVGPPRE